MRNQKNAKEAHLPFFGIPRIARYLAPYRLQFALMLGLGLTVSLIDIFLPLLQQYAINNYVVTGRHDSLPIFIVIYVAVLALQVTVNCISTFAGSKIELRVGRDLKQACFDHLQTLSFSYFNQNSVGYLHARVMSDTSRIGEVVSWCLLDGMWNLAYVIGAVIVMFSLSPPLAAAVCTVVPLIVLLIALCQRKLTHMNRTVRELNSKITGNYNEGIMGAETIKTVCIEDDMQERFVRDTGEMRSTSVRTMRMRATLSSVVSFFGFVALAIVLWRGGSLTVEGVMLIGGLQVFMSYALGMMEPLQWVLDAISQLIATRVNIERVTKLLDTESDVSDSQEVIARYGDTFSPRKEGWEEIIGDVTFDDVTFRYPDGKETVLEHFSLEVPAGSVVAIVGETGAGKSTLVNLVCRFYEPTEGRVLIDGRDARERSQLWLHSAIGYVLQTPHLFSGTVRDNLTYGNPDADDEEIMQALRLVSAEDVVMRMEHGLDSEVGESGDLLSTGEKQLLSFARAILANPRILILDEATSSIDSVTEEVIRRATAKVTEGRTTFLIAHRLSTVREADVILAVKEGRIVERGTHAELLAAGGYYANLWQSQFERESVDAVGANGV